MARIVPRTVTLRNGEVCVIRSLEAADAPASLEHRHRFSANAPLVLTMPDEVPTNVEEQRKSIVDRLEHANELLIGACIGTKQVATAGLKCMAPKRKVRHVVDLGIGVDPLHRGLGLGRELMVTMLDWAVAHPVIQQVWLNVYPENTPALKLYESLGFVTQYTRHQFFIHDDGTYHDDVGMLVYVKPGIAHAGCRTYPACLAT